MAIQASTPKRDTTYHIKRVPGHRHAKIALEKRTKDKG